MFFGLIGGCKSGCGPRRCGWKVRGRQELVGEGGDSERHQWKLEVCGWVTGYFLYPFLLKN